MLCCARKLVLPQHVSLVGCPCHSDVLYISPAGQDTVSPYFGKMSNTGPLTDSVSRISRDANHQAKIEEHRDLRISKTLEHRDSRNAHLDKAEQKRVEALERVHAARQKAYERAGLANAPAIVDSESRLMKHLDKVETRRTEALEKVHDRRAKAELKSDRRVAKIESHGNDVRDRVTSERELRHFEREHRKEAAKEVGHIESARELALRQARERQSRDKGSKPREDQVMYDADDSDGSTAEPTRPGVFTVKMSSEG